MSLLEDRYRFVLRVLRASYRQVWEEEMVATFVDSVTDTGDPEDVELARPSWPEVASVLALAVRLRLTMLRLRLDGVGAPARRVSWGVAVRRVALVGLLVNALTATMVVGQLLWLAEKIPWLPAPREEWLAAWAHPWPADGWETFWIATGLVWLPAYLALVLGRRRVALLLGLAGLLTLGPAVVDTVTHTLNSPAGRALPGLITEWSWLLIVALPVLALVAFHPDSAPIPRRPWLIAFAVGIVLVQVPGVVVLLRSPYGGWLDGPGLYCVGVVAATVVHLARPNRAPSWSLTLAVLALVVLWLRLTSLLDYYLNYSGEAAFPVATFRAAGVAQAVAVLAVAVPLVVLATRARRRLPSGSADAAAPSTSIR
ncbi:MAG TPA: hypothetical protein VHN78_15330 [Chloroflexota bacterium]|nr:hypothetical protein [Chloroflexota bacterium]